MSEPTYVIGYARVSTPKQAQEGEGLEDQEKAIKRYCAKMGWTLFPDDSVYKEPYTGTTTDRPVYMQILGMLKANKKAINVQYFVFWDFDRLTRAGTIDYDQIWKDVKNYNVALRDTAGIIQPERDAFEEFGLKKKYDFAVARPSEDAEKEKIEDARKDRIKILQRLIKPQIKLTQEGYHIGKGDYGFENKQIFVDNKKKCIQVRYEPEAKFVERIYELRVQGILNDQEICDDVNALGYRSRIQKRWSKDKRTVIGTIGGIELTSKQLQKMIQRTTYCGVLCEEWTNHNPIKAKYEGLVSVDVWNKANRDKVFLEENADGTCELLFDVGVHGHKRKRYNPQFPRKGILLCEMCGKKMKASASTGKSGKSFGAYHCERKHERNAFSQKIVEDAFDKFMKNLRFTDEFLEVFGKTIHTQFRVRESELAEYTAKANINVADLEMEKSTLIKSFPQATLPSVRQGLEEEINKLQKQIDKAKSQRDLMEVDEADVTSFIGWCRDIMEHPEKMLEDIRSEQELIHTASIFFDEFPTHTQIVSGTPKLSLVFKLSEEFKVDESSLVTPRRIELRFQD